MKVHIIGQRSYLAGVLETRLGKDFDVRRSSAHEFSAAAVRSGDVIINCAWEPDLYEKKIRDDLSWDGRFSQIAQEREAYFVMMSSRAVYANRVDPPLLEGEYCHAQTVYGRNKTTVEAGLQRIIGPRLLITRIGNVFGNESTGRRTFVSTALESLRTRGEIELRMAPETRKDFLPVCFLGNAFRALISERAHGIYNVSSGLTLTVRDVAEALVRGYGSGTIRITDWDVGEEFLLDTTKLNTHTGLSIGREDILAALERSAREHRQ